ncbi:hypothetical protein BCR33DRAFT_601646 [Rhizoclosmatium globosum]|uniref:Zn(2)-C6 fungal-type domain-containing protein n=1 Tax=Rhizoclosmatium globosum TaxID=329046 RepID=A0A1Y2AZ57_9FUNG|nr:hypothetical protein BCR33DRAFT_601646 [Rhizoclosmatium globosum]|eukprot:ORY27858.1 hypothetical protein BCR33DRAFT_601646 [Rhizoclosmatium globosum]
MNLAHYPAQQQYPQIQPKARASCLRCRNHKKKCTPRVSGACERCYSIGVDYECSHSHELITPTTPSFPLPPPPLLLNTTTTPITAPDQNKSPNTPTLADAGLNWFDRQSGSTTPPPSQPVLTQIMNAFETPLIQGDELAMEDPDLMPTREDWDLVYRYCTKNGTCRPLMVAMDGEYHVSHYFGQSAVLR